MLGQGARERTGVLPTPCLSFPACEEEMAGQTLTPQGWHRPRQQWHSVGISGGTSCLAKKKGGLRAMPGQIDGPICPGPGNARGQGVSLEGTKVSPSF